MKKTLYILLFTPFFAFGQLTPCEQDVENAIGLIGEYVPQCEEDGSYSPMQCWSSTGYCWCVDENGLEIPGTSIQSWLGTPDCSNNQETCVAVPVENCDYLDIWAPVCGCDNVTYSSVGHAACNSIFEFTIGECGTSNDIFGCTDFLSCNFNSEANIDDGSCIYAEMYYDCYGECINDFDLDGVCDELDNCIDESNADQLDDDSDGEGDACDYDDGIGIVELNEKPPVLIKMVDVLGREQQEHKKGSLLFYIYDNGKVEKKFNP